MTPGEHQGERAEKARTHFDALVQAWAMLDWDGVGLHAATLASMFPALDEERKKEPSSLREKQARGTLPADAYPTADDVRGSLAESVPAGSERGPRAHSVQRDIEEFHRALDIPVESTPAIRRPELRAELIREEARETVEAIERGDLVEAIDGLCDILAVTYGAAAEFGIDLAPFWDEVHRTNMAKRGGPVREDGKRLKPEGWQPPDIAGILAALQDTEEEK